MAGDLERFLQQAAERLSNQMQQAAEPAARRRPERDAERRPQHVDDDIVDAVILDEADERRRGTNPLSSIDTRDQVVGDVTEADERMQDHVHEALDHDIVHLDDASKALGGSETGASVAGQVKHRKKDVSSLVLMLRNPETLKQAFLVSEIFNRKF